MSVDAADAEIRWQSVDAQQLAEQPEADPGWTDISGETRASLTPSDVYGAYYTLYAYRAVVTVDGESSVTDAFSPETDPDIDAPLTADALAAYFGMTTDELAAALEISEDELLAMPRPEIVDIYLAYGLSFAAPLVEVAEPSASSRVYFYNQARVPGDGQDSWRLLAVEGDTLGQKPDAAPGRLGSGCAIYAFAHAIQYLTGEKRSSVDGGALLQMLIDVHDRPYDEIYPYRNFLRNECGIPRASVPDSEASLLSLMQSGGAVISLIRQYGFPSGHYSLAVGAVQADFGDGMKTWVHMVDSTCGSTFARMFNQGHTPYDFDTHEPITTDSGWYKGGEYWVSYESYEELFIRATAYYRGGKTPSLKATCPTVSYERCTYKITQDVTLRQSPLSSAAAGDTLSAGDTVTSTQIVDNGSQYWLKLTNGQYIYSGYDNTGAKTGTQYLRYVSSSPSVTWSSNNIFGSTLTLGASCSIRGTLSSNNTIRSITAEIYQEGQRVGSAVRVDPYTTSYPMSGSAIDLGIPFGSLAAGSYTLLITTEYSFNRMQSAATHTLASPFSVAANGKATPSTLQFVGVTYPKTFVINTSRGWGLSSGTLSSNYPLVSLRSRIVNESGDALSDSGVLSISGVSYAIATLDTLGGDDNGVSFSHITSPGSYRWILTAADASGKQLSLSMPFTAVSSGTTSTTSSSAAYIAPLAVTLDASDAQLKPGGTRTLTATVTPSNATGLTLSWSSSNPAVAKVSSDGKVTALSAGEAAITCRTENGVTARCRITVAEDKATIITQPQDAVTTEGRTATVTLKASGEGLTYEWYYKNAGSDVFWKTSTFTGSRYAVTMTPARDGREIYCVVTDAYGNSVTSDTVSLRMDTPVKITVQPESISVPAGSTASVPLTAEGTGLTYEWYYKNEGSAAFYRSPNITGDTYHVPMTAARNNRQIYCVVTDVYGNSATSDTVTLSMENAVRITSESGMTTVPSGETATYTVLAEGDGLTYRWYYKNEGSAAFYRSPNITGDTYHVPMTADRNNRQIYCVVTDAYGVSVRSSIATLSMENAVRITSEVRDTTVPSGETATFTVLAEGDGLTYRWYYKNASGASFVKTPTFTGDTYHVAMTSARNGRQIYCVVTDAYGNSVRSSVVTLMRKETSEEACAAAITRQPEHAVAANGEAFTVSVGAEGDGLTYEWYYKNASGTSFVKTPTFTADSYATTMTPARNGRKIYCVVTDKYGNSVKSSTVSLIMTE